MNVNLKQHRAEEAARLIKSSATKIRKALEIMEENGLNLENYPEYWKDFAEHPEELENIFVSDFSPNSNVQVMVGDTN